MWFRMADDGAFARRVLITIGIVGLALLVWYLVDVALLFFGAILTAVLLRAVAAPFERWLGLGPNWALVLGTGFLLLVIGLATFLFGSEVRVQTLNLLETLPSAWDLMLGRLFSGDISDELMAQVEGAMPAAGQILSGVLIGAWSIAGGITALVLILGGGLYLAAQPEVYRHGFLVLLPDDGKREQAAETLDAMGEALKLWLLGQLLTMGFIFAITLVGLWAIGVQGALALAVFAGLAQFVPIVGPIVAAIPALMVALVAGYETVLWVLGLYIVIQQLESNIITPLVQRRTVSLPPVLPLFAVVVFALLFGVMGVLLATPLAVIAFVAIKKLWVRDALGEDTHLPGEPLLEPGPEETVPALEDKDMTAVAIVKVKESARRPGRDS